MTSIEKIKKLCKETKGVSLHKLEMDLGYGNGYFSKLKSIPVERLSSVAKYFNVPVYSLLPDENEKAAAEISDGYDKHAELISLFDVLSVEQQDRIIAQLRDLAQLQRVLGALSES